MPQLSEVLDVAELVFSRGRSRGAKGGRPLSGGDPALRRVNEALDKVARKLIGRIEPAKPPPSPYPAPGLRPKLNPPKKPLPAPTPAPAPARQSSPKRDPLTPRDISQPRSRDPGTQSGKGVVRMSDALRVVAMYAVPAMRATAQQAMLRVQLGQFNRREKVALAPLYPGEPTKYVQYRVPGGLVDRGDDLVEQYVTAQTGTT